MAEKIIKKLGKYDIVRILGKGAMGVVYEGIDPVIERKVAIKTIRSDLDASDPELTMGLARFKREAQAAGRLVHPNIVAVYEYGEDQDVSYIVMEFVEGRSLKDAFDAEERFDLKSTVEIMTSLLDALGHAHKQGVVHRDIKPANIMISKDGDVKITDFGIARIETSTMTQAGTVLGTPSYMSPEQFMGQTVDQRSDLFSTGAMLYQMLTGEKPFAGSLTTIMHKVLNEMPTRPSALNVQVIPSFDKVVEKALAKRPDDRFQSAKEFTESIKIAFENPDAFSENEDEADEDATVLQGIPGPGQIPAAPAAKPKSSKPVKPKIPVSEEEEQKKGKGKLIAIVAALVLLIGGGAAVFMTMGKDEVPISPVTPPPAEVAVVTPEPAPVVKPPVVTPTRPEPVETPPPSVETPEPVVTAEPVELPPPVVIPPKIEPVVTKPPVPKPGIEPVRLALFSNGGKTLNPFFMSGENLVVVLQTNVDAHVYCFYRQADGNILRLYPNQWHSDSFIKAKTSLKIPANPNEFELKMLPNSHEKIMCISTPHDRIEQTGFFKKSDNFKPLEIKSIPILRKALERIVGPNGDIKILNITVR